MSEEQSSYDHFATKLLETGIFSDPWLEGSPRFRMEPLLVPEVQRESLYQVAEQIASVYNEACRVIDASEEYLDDFFKLTPVQKLMWEASRPFWHGIARADIFLTEEGPVACELNCDTPTGEPEAVLLNALIEAPANSFDPNTELADRVCSMLEEVTRKTLGEECPEQLTVGLIYPTELTEDLSVIHLYRRWLEAHGWIVVLGSPQNLSRNDEGDIFLFEQQCHLILRHYKTDWWGERKQVWLDAAPFLDPEPLAEPLLVVLQGPLSGRCAVMNPFGSVLAQNKRMMAFFWEKLDHFSRTSQQIIRQYIPYTCRLEAMLREQLSAERELWVIKSDYGAEGDEVILGPHCSQEEWDQSLRQAAPGRWIAQRYFQATEIFKDTSINYGVFLVAGQACGLYLRAQEGATDTFAQSTPVFISSEATSI